ncbi:JAB domain-containing protein [Niabella sp. 22666]|uniref:JAB domain-containing protein n=1 Tax=Niabella sp. 22666 TaxID=3453954 RepID=UPI003F83F480
MTHLKQKIRSTERSAVSSHSWEAPTIHAYINEAHPINLTIKEPEQADAVFRELWPDDSFSYQEQWALLALNRNNQVIGCRTIQTGHITVDSLDSGFLFTMAAISAAERVIIARNEPLRSRATIPNDLMVLHKIKWGMSLFNIEIMDFLVMYESAVLSFYHDLKDEVTTLPLVGYKEFGKL